MMLALISNDRSLVMGLFPVFHRCPPSLSFLPISWLQSPFELMTEPILFRDYLVLKLNIQLTEVT